MRILWLQVFREAVRRGSLGEASRALGYTQSAVSRHIAALEAEFGVTLLERRPAGVRPTPYGDLLLQHADAVLAHDDQLRREFDGVQKGTLGHIAVGAFPTAVAGIIPAAVNALQQDRPDTTFSLLEARTPALIEHVHARDLDVAVVTDGPGGHGLPASLDCTHLFDEQLLVAVGHAHRLARRRAVYLSEIIGETFITGSDSDENVLLRAHSLHGFQPPSQIIVAGWIGKLACIAAGLGIALVPQLITRVLPAGVTVLKLRDEQAPYRRVVAVTDARRQPSELMRMFIRLAEQSARA